MVVSWEEIVVPRKKNGNKINNGDSIKRRTGYFVASDGLNVAVACDDGILRTVNLSENRDVEFFAEEEQHVNPT